MARHRIPGPATRAAQARAAIVHHAQECEKSLRLAAFAEGEGALPSIAPGLRKLAAYSAEQAFAWARHIPTGATA